VVKLMPFGAFIEVLPGKDGLLHVSQIGGTRRVNNVEDAIRLGDVLKVKVTEIDDQGRVNLSRRGIGSDPFDAVLEQRMASAPEHRQGGRPNSGGRPPRRRPGDGGRNDR